MFSLILTVVLQLTQPAFAASTSSYCRSEAMDYYSRHFYSSHLVAECSQIVSDQFEGPKKVRLTVNPESRICIFTQNKYVQGGLWIVGKLSYSANGVTVAGYDNSNDILIEMDPAYPMPTVGNSGKFSSERERLDGGFDRLSYDVQTWPTRFDFSYSSDSALGEDFIPYAARIRKQLSSIQFNSNTGQLLIERLSGKKGPLGLYRKMDHRNLTEFRCVVNPENI